jgi:AcrR family transcriptional regulator
MSPIARRKKEKELRRKAILRAAQQLFYKKGFRSVTVECIAKQARLSKGTVYLYFESKEELYAQVLLNEVEKFQERVNDIVEMGDSASEMLFKYAHIYADFFLNERELFRILMTFMLHTDDLRFSDEMRRRMIRATTRTVEIIDRIFRYGLDSGEFVCTESIRKSRNAVWGLLNGVISLHLYTGKEGTREERIYSNITEGLKVFIGGLKESRELSGQSAQ